MSKAVANFRQLDVSRAIRAVRGGGLNIESVVIDANNNCFTIKVKDGNAIPIEPRRKREDDADDTDISNNDQRLADPS